jgi:hypothetical protein
MTGAGAVSSIVITCDMACLRQLSRTSDLLIFADGNFTRGVTPYRMSGRISLDEEKTVLKELVPTLACRNSSMAGVTPARLWWNDSEKKLAVGCGIGLRRTTLPSMEAG